MGYNCRTLAVQSSIPIHGVKMKYCEAIYRSRRLHTREVKVGKVGVGGNNPVRIQSMTTSNTRDVAATIEQIIRLADGGCEIARVTVQGMKEAAACEEIKNGLLQKGYEIPLVADIHFYPPAAMHVVDFVDKVRINPGNYVDKRALFKTREYDDKSYAEEIEKIEEGFAPLVEKCLRLKRAMRIGTNHGSLSDRIMNRYGDTAFGMVESALEFARVCRKLNYHDLIFSMKASNPLVMIQAYRLLVAEMMQLGWDYPLHLGVTEAGLGEDGRVKSAVGIGSLLLDGIGDTIRVSLTEDPWEEIDPCERLIDFAKSYEDKGTDLFEEKGRDIAHIARRKTVGLPPLHRDGTVVMTQAVAQDAAFKPDIVLSQLPPSFLREHDTLVEELKEPFALIITDHWEKLTYLKPLFILFSPTTSRLHQGRRFFDWLKEHQIEIPVILDFDYDCSFADLVIRSAAECGALLSDGLGEGICLRTPYEGSDIISLSLNILQAARMRAFKTEFISCPSCGRTLFDLQQVTKRIRERTSHLPGVKIAIMGCIVNGPGEMADSDFGYVGSKAGKIDLYVGKTCVERNIDFNEADERLIALIKSHNRWIDQ